MATKSTALVPVSQQFRRTFERNYQHYKSTYSVEYQALVPAIPPFIELYINGSYVMSFDFQPGRFAMLDTPPPFSSAGN
ncbi:hypothetical protein O9992_24170 [Vibrio lentus]|nr:hypothetical protein [Vibrio lentus]